MHLGRAAFFLALAACASPDVEPETECGPQMPCPAGFTCDPIGGRCLKQTPFVMTVPDAMPDGLALADAATDAPVADAPPDAAEAPDGAAPPSLAISPSGHDFGSVTLEAASAPFVFTVTNIGGSPTTALGASVGTTSSYTITAGSCAGVLLGPGKSCTVAVRFNPTGVTGAQRGKLLISALPAQPVSAELGGIALSEASLTVSPLSHTFVPLVIGGTSVEATFTIRNAGQSPTGLPVVRLSNEDDFLVSTNKCTAAVGGGGSCTVGVRFQPMLVGARAATLAIDFGAAGGVSVPLDGVGLATLDVVPAGNGGGRVVSDPDGIDCKGTCSATFAVDEVTLSATPDALSTFTSWSGGGCAGSGPCVVSMSGSATVTATFSRRPPKLALSPPAQDLGQVTLGAASAPVTFTLANGGGLPSGTLGAAASDPSFSVTGGTCLGASIDPNGSCTVLARFNPTGAAGVKSATLTVSGAAGVSATATLSGKALTVAAIALDAGSWGYGNVALGSASGDAVFTVRNNGESPALGLGASVTGDFAVSSSSCSGALGAGASCSVAVHFVPGSVGGKSGTLTVSASPGGSTSATLSGTGMALLSVTPAGAGSGLVTSDTGGISCPGTCAAWTTTPTVNLTASAGAWSSFAGWSGACSGAGGCQVSLTASKSVTASFGLTPPALSVAPTYQDFGPETVNLSSAPVYFTVTNSGGQAAGTLYASVSDPYDYTILAGYSTCFSQQLGGMGASCTVAVVFSPDAPIGAKSAGLTLTGGNGGYAYASLAGTATCLAYGQVCTTGGLCCDSVPCTGGRCRYP